MCVVVVVSHTHVHTCARTFTYTHVLNDPPSLPPFSILQYLIASLSALRRGELALNDAWAVTIQRTLDYTMWQTRVLPEALRARSQWVYSQMVNGAALPPCQRYVPAMRRSPGAVPRSALPLQ
jgi:hypothetical protein